MLRLFLLSLALFVGLMATPAGVPSAAQAQVSIDIRVGTSLYGGRWISCSEGRRRLERRGFRDVRIRDCRGRIYSYTGRRDGRRWWIDVRARDGRIVRLDRYR
jgi:hypothetical protein